VKTRRNICKGSAQSGATFWVGVELMHIYICRSTSSLYKVTFELLKE